MESEWIIKTGIIQETRLMEIMELIYEDLALWFLQWKNISLQFVDIDKENLQRTLDEVSPEGAEWLFFPCELALFSTNRSVNSPRLSLAGQTSSTYILSGTPTKKTSPSLNFLKMQPEFITCLLASLITISALMSGIDRALSFRFSTLKDFGRQFLENLWSTSLLFFYEPLIRKLRILSSRIVVSVWLIAISFIYFDMCSNLSSNFAETKYSFVDSVANMPRDRYGDVVVIENYVEEIFVNKMAKIDDNYLQLKKRMKRVEQEFFLVENPIPKFLTTNIILILAEIFGKIAMIELKMSLEERGALSFSEPLYTTFIVFPIARNASSRTVDTINGFSLLEMEKKIMSKYFNEMNFRFFGLKWTKPGETFRNTTFADIKSVLDLFVMGSLLASLIFIVECSTALFRGTLNISSRRRGHEVVRNIEYQRAIRVARS